MSTEIPNKYPTVEDQIEVYNYCIIGIFEELFTGVLLITLSLFLNIFAPVVIISITFTLLRSVAGGYHFKTHFRCVIVSMLMFIGSALVIKYTYPYWTQTNIIVLFILTVLIGIYVIVRYVPRDTENKRITESEEISKFKRWTYIYLITWSTIVIGLILFNTHLSNLIIISSCFGFLLELFSVSKLGYNVYYFIERKIN